MPSYGRLWKSNRRRGMALINALLIMALMTLMLVTGIQFTQTARKAGKTDRYDQQAYNVARAGLVDAINWFKRSAVQPVTAFRPIVNPVNALKGDTNDPARIDPGADGGKLDPGDSPRGGNDDKPSLGIVQEYPLDAATGLWARYEVGKITRYDAGRPGQSPTLRVMERDRSGTLVPKALSDATSNEWEGVKDLSANYGLEGQGLAWRIVSHGYVYRRDPDDTRSYFYQSPNTIVGEATLETEIYRLQVRDWLAAVHSVRGDAFDFNNTSKIRITADGGAGVMYNAGTGTPNPGSAPGTFSGSFGAYRSVAPGHSLSWSEMFGVSTGDVLASMADVYVTNVSQLPSTLSTMALVYVKGNATFDAGRKLKGGGILVVDGDLTIAADADTFYTGLIYCTGNYTQNSPSLVTGGVYAKGNVTVTASGGEDCFIEYNQELLNEIRRQLGQYRERKTASRVLNY